MPAPPLERDHLAPAEAVPPSPPDLMQELKLEYVQSHPSKLKELPMGISDHQWLFRLAIEPLRIKAQMQKGFQRNYRALDTFLIGFSVAALGGDIATPRRLAEAGRWAEVADGKILDCIKANSPIRPKADEIYSYQGIADADGDIPLLGLNVYTSKDGHSKQVPTAVDIYAVATPLMRENIRLQFLQKIRPVLDNVLKDQIEEARRAEGDFIELQPAILVEKALALMRQELPEWQLGYEMPGLAQIAASVIISFLHSHSDYDRYRQTAEDLRNLMETAERGNVIFEHDDVIKKDHEVGWYPDELIIRVPKMPLM